MENCCSQQAYTLLWLCCSFWQSLKSESKIAGIAVLFKKKKHYKYTRKQWHSFFFFWSGGLEKVYGPSLEVSFESWMSVGLVSVCLVELFLSISWVAWLVVKPLSAINRALCESWKGGCEYYSLGFSFSICNLYGWQKWKWGILWIVRAEYIGRIS